MAREWVNTIRTDGLAEQSHAGSVRGMRIATEHVLGVANTRVPHEDGDLERSGSASVDTGTPVRGAVSYDTDYAADQHENMSYHHDEGRQAKYLESALTSEADTIRDIIATAIKRDLGLS